MKFYKPLYCEQNLKQTKYMIMWKLKHRKTQMDLYVILLGRNSDQLEFFHASYLQQTYYQQQEVVVVGIAASKMGAMKLIEELTREVYDKTGDVKIKEYLMRKKG